MKRSLSIISEQSEENEASAFSSPTNLSYKSSQLPSIEEKLWECGDSPKESSSSSLMQKLNKSSSDLETTLIESFSSEKYSPYERCESDLDKLVSSRLVSGNKCSCTCNIF